MTAASIYRTAPPRTARPGDAELLAAWLAAEEDAEAWGIEEYTLVQAMILLVLIMPLRPAG